MSNPVHANFLAAFEETIKNSWNSIALTEYPNRTLLYSDLAYGIEQYHQLWSSIGLKKGERIAIFSKNNTDYVIALMAAITAGYVCVIIPPTLSDVEVSLILSHSACRLLYTDTLIYENVELSSILTLIAVFDIRSKKMTYQNDSCKFAFTQSDIVLKSSDIHYCKLDYKETIIIIYTSGTSKIPNGVICSFGFTDLNVKKMLTRFSYSDGEAIISFCPFFHVLGLTAELFPALCSGLNLVMLPRLNTSEIFEAFQQFTPKLAFAVPMLLEKYIVFCINKQYSVSFSSVKELYSDITFCSEHTMDLSFAFGGKIEVIGTGGAPLSGDMEKIIRNIFRLPLITLYGLTEAGYISIGAIGDYRLGSCGKVVSENPIRVDSDDPSISPGEIQIYQGGIFSGYFNNPTANVEAFSNDGWFKTGDLGLIDEGGNMFIIGRCKDLLLTSNGENIFPEAIENTINDSRYVRESLLVQRGEKLHVIVVPDREKAEAENLDAACLDKKIDEAVREASKKLPGFTIISGFELRDEPLERTPKGSLKRYLYSDGIKEN